MRLFRDRTREFIESVTAERKPSAVGVCMLYYLDETAGGSWADRTLSALGYDKDPSKLQLVMRKVFELGTAQVRLPGVERVVAIPLYEALDGRDTADYVERVEPSAQGGKKMARQIVERLLAEREL